MYAIVVTGGKQYKVRAGDTIEVEKLKANVGDKIELEVLLAVKADTITLDKKPKVSVEVLSHGKGKKLIVYKYKAKKNVRTKKGHRQQYTKLKILTIA